MENKKIKLITAPCDFEIIQQIDGYADILIAGEFLPDDDDDTEQPMPFSKDKVFARVIDESDGCAVTLPVRLSTNGNDFEATISRVPAGGTYTLDFIMLDPEHSAEYHVRGERRRHIGVGDVYLVMGQSNASGMAKGEITDAPELGVHVLRNLDRWDIASSPFSDLDYSRQNMLMTFAKKLKSKLGYPIGIIPGAMGGAPLSRWLTSERGDLYKKAIEATRNTKIKGVIWYQGCTDAAEGCSTDSYFSRFSELVSQLRRDFENENLPIFTFQLNRQKRRVESPVFDSRFDNIREAQRIAAKRIQGVYVIPTVDCMQMSDFVHLSKSSCITLGERLARRILGKLYGIGLTYDAPEVISAKQTDARKIVATFSGVTEYLYDFNAPFSAYPITVRDDLGAVGISAARLAADRAELTLERAPVGNVTLSGQCGIDPKNIIIDYGTQLPMISFKDFPVER